jgi:uncharacterized protein (DUF1800 family)
MSATTAFVASRRRLFGAMLASVGAHPGAAPARHRPGRTGLSALDLVASPASMTMPPAAVRWLTRATHGYSTSDLVAFNALGANDDARWSAWVAQQLDPASIDDTACTNRVANAGYQTLGLSVPQLWDRRNQTGISYFERMRPIAEIEAATIIRQTYSKRQLFEVMVGFWHDHFSTFGWDYDGGTVFVQYDRDVIRPNALGNFRTLLEAVAKSTTMMYYLDQYASTRDGPNENFAREMMELHTLGVENYAGILDPFDPSLPTGTGADGQSVRMKYVDNDVYEAARALTGWTVKNGHWEYPSENDGTYTYRLAWHDPANKFILNRTFSYNAGDNERDGHKVFDILCGHPGTARFIATKLCRRFVHDTPSTTLIDAVADCFFNAWAAPDQIKQMVAIILASDDFKTSWGTKMKRPAMAAISALRGLGAEFTPALDNTNDWTTSEEFISRVQQTGHRWLYWPSPNGYPDVQTAWSSSSALGMTFKLLARIPEMHVTNGDGTTPFLADVQAQTLAAFPNASDRNADNLVGYWCDRLLGYRPEPTCTTLVNFLRQNAAANAALDIVTDSGNSHNGVWNGGDLSRHYTIARLRTTVALILCSPEFLRR